MLNKLSIYGDQITPQYEHQFQIDEAVFDKVLEDELPHHKQRAKERDINSVRSIYVLRKGYAPNTVETSKAILVSSNVAFARAAYKYGQNHEELSQVSSVITNFSLANMAWLKSPMGAISLPEMEVLSFSYAALRPSPKLLDKYLKEIERLEKKDKITEQDHQLLRSKLADDELMNLTLGDEAALSEETITETLQRVTNDIKKEESKKLKAEQEAHKKTQQKLTEEKQKTQKTQEKMHWDCRKKAKNLSFILTGLIILFQAMITFISLYFTFTGFIILILTLLFTLLDMFELKSFIKIRKNLEDRSFNYFIRRMERVTGFKLRH